MRIEAIKYFIKAANEGSVNRASDMLHISHQNLGKVLSSVEQELDLDLVNRGRKGLTLTSHGKFVYERFLGIERLYNEVENYAHAVHDETNSAAEVMNIFMAGSIMPEALAKAVCELDRRYPDLQIKVTECSGREALKGVLNAENGLANVVVPDNMRDLELKDRGLRILMERPIRMALLLPLAKSDLVQGGGIDVRQLESVPLVQYISGNMEDSYISHSLGETETLRIRHTTNNLAVYNQLINSGEYGTVSMFYEGDGPLGAQYLKNSIFSERAFMIVPVLRRNKPIRARVIWCCRQDQSITAPMAYFMSLL